MATGARGVGAALALTAGCLSAAALAEADVFGLGDGHRGELVVDYPEVAINPASPLVAAATSTTVPVASTFLFSPGDLVMLYRAAGSCPPLDGGAIVDIVGTGIGDVELARVSSISGGALHLTAPLQATWSAPAQVILVPEFSSVAVSDGGSLVASPWNGVTGGVLAFLSQGQVANQGRISASGAGLRGGIAVDGPPGSGCVSLNEPGPDGAQRGESICAASWGPTHTGRGAVASGAGGGDCVNSGGAGGGHGGPGGSGGRSYDGARPVGGIGGSALAYPFGVQFAFGGGGGAGHTDDGELMNSGGRGGGVVFLRGNQLVGDGVIEANGANSPSGDTDGAGGGGAGGAVVARFVGAASCGAIQARGGDGGWSMTTGGAHGPGGGGGGGRVLLQAEPSGACPVDVASGIAGQTPVANPNGFFFGAAPDPAGSASFVGTIDLVVTGLPPGDAGSTAGIDAGCTPPPPLAVGCACSDAAGAAAASLAILAAALLRRATASRRAWSDPARAP